MGAETPENVAQRQEHDALHAKLASMEQRAAWMQTQTEVLLAAQNGALQFSSSSGRLDWSRTGWSGLTDVFVAFFHAVIPAVVRHFAEPVQAPPPVPAAVEGESPDSVLLRQVRHAERASRAYRAAELAKLRETVIGQRRMRVVCALFGALGLWIVVVTAVLGQNGGPQFGAMLLVGAVLGWWRRSKTHAARVEAQRAVSDDAGVVHGADLDTLLAVEASLPNDVVWPGFSLSETTRN